MARIHADFSYSRGLPRGFGCSADELTTNPGGVSMNKKLLAVAVVGALASPAAFAQGTPTTLYGIFDMGYQNASGTDVVNKNFFQQGQRDPSRFGIKGSEDLEAGMYAMYGFEF